MNVLHILKLSISTYYNKHITNSSGNGNSYKSCIAEDSAGNGKHLKLMVIFFMNRTRDH